MVAPLGAFSEANSATEACILRYVLHVGVFGLRRDLRGPDPVCHRKLESRGGVRGEVNLSPELWGQGEETREKR